MANKNKKLTETIERLETKIAAFDEKKNRDNSDTETEDAVQLKQTLNEFVLKDRSILKLTRNLSLRVIKERLL